ncbi:transposase [Aneurinibacillus thermoaerophilus]|uniref:transposase n=1 Tax=Aneurinibacillus thermoaerophilus TaxID=143495 RepID=UPI002E22FA7F|nr:transposase [Aneurinibacillus thermoaerophilus]
MAKKGQKFQHYTPELKTEAVRLYEEEGMSYQAVAERLEIRSNTQVKRWVKKYRNDRCFTKRRIRCESQTCLPLNERSRPSVGDP